MAQLYKVNNKRYEFVEIDSSVTTAYVLSESDFNKWIKADTTTASIDIQMPDGLSEGFRCIVENTGVFTVNYINGAGTSLATQQDNITEDQYRTVELVFNSSEWRVQGYIGRNDISSLYDVNTDAQGVPNNGDVLQYDFNAGIWTAASQPPLFARSAETIDFILTEEDHGKIIPVDTTFAPVDVAINLGLPDGFKVRLINVGTGVMTITAAPTLNIESTSINTQYTAVDLFHSGLETYFGSVNNITLPSSPFDYLKINSTGTEALAGGAAAIAIGENVTASGNESISIGINSSSATDAVCVGPGAAAGTVGCVALGHNANADTGNGAIAIGNGSSATGVASVSLGRNAITSLINSVQLGEGTNSTQDTLQYLNRTIATTEGIKAFDIAGIPGGSASNGNLAVDTNTNELYVYSSSAWRSVGISETTGTPVTTPAVATARFDPVTNILYIYNGSTWVSTTLT